MNPLLGIICKLEAKRLVATAQFETVVTYATVEQLMYEYEQLCTTEEQKRKMLNWAMDPSNPNPNAPYFLKNVRTCLSKENVDLLQNVELSREQMLTQIISEQHVTRKEAERILYESDMLP